jgi:hypothetical protein
MQRTVEDYRIIEEKSLHRLRIRVRELLPAGYEPTGDIGDYEDTKEGERIFYVQVIKKIKEE